MSLRRGLAPAILLFLCSESAFAEADDFAAKVRANIDRALAAKTQDGQQDAFESILRLGCAAVPAIVDQLDDRRKLPISYLRLDNDWPDAFEAFRQYGPEVMTDALAAILNDITLWDCGFIFNGASEAERTQSVQCWQKFVRETPVKNCGAK